MSVTTQTGLAPFLVPCAAHPVCTHELDSKISVTYVLTQSISQSSDLDFRDR